MCGGLHRDWAWNGYPAFLELGYVPQRKKCHISTICMLNVRYVVGIV